MTEQFIDANRSTDALQQDRQWQAVLNSAGEGIWGVDLDGNCTFVNRAATRIFGYGSGELVGSRMHSMVHHHHADGSVYADEDCPVYGVFRNNKPLRQQRDTMFRKDGSSFLAEMSAEPVTVNECVVGVVVTFRDVSEQHRQQEDLRRAYEVAEQRTAELNAVIESIPHGVFIATPDGKVRSNRRAREMTGERFPAQLHTLERALHGDHATETAHIAQSWIRSVAAPIVLDQQVLGGVAVNTDITQLRQQEDVLRKSEKLAAIGQLTSAIAHEINDPLESITNLLYLVRHAETMDEVQEYARVAEQELSRVSEITLQTLRFHRHNNKPDLVDMAALMTAVTSLYASRFLVRGVTVHWKLLPVLPVMCLEGEIRQVLNNFVRNALDAMPEGGKLFLRLRLQAGPAGREGVCIVIGDTGEGVCPHILDHLFEPFHTTKDVTGTGLGLWVSKGIIDKHGGSIMVRTRRKTPHGTVFRLWLPIDGVDLSPVKGEPEITESGDAAF